MKRKLERFVKTMSFELTIPDSETGRNGAYEARFLDEIADEIDTLENKKDTLFCECLLITRKKFSLSNTFEVNIAERIPSSKFNYVIFVSG
jgi:hypothetical protein